MTLRLSTLLTPALAIAALIALGFSEGAEASYYYDEPLYRDRPIPCYAYDAYGHCISCTRSRTGRARYDYRVYRPNVYDRYFPYYRPVSNHYRRNDDCYWYYGNYTCYRGGSAYDYPYGYSRYPYGY